MKPDSLIFDMDGTLWDAVDTYVLAWNNSFDSKKLPHTVTRDDLLSCMGKDVKTILKSIFTDEEKRFIDELADEVNSQYRALMPTMSFTVYPGVNKGLERLSKQYKLFMLSNCEKDSLPNFMKHTHTSHLFTDYMEFGMNLQPKSVNLKLLKEKHQLQNPFYIGDTDHDAEECCLAGIPFVYVTYGFGQTSKYDYVFDSFLELTDYFLTL